jgi:hypothetical protein
VSTDPTGAPGGPAAGPADAQPSEEELRAAYEAELSRITSADMMLQAAVSLLNIGSYRLAPAPPDAFGAPGASPPEGRDLGDLDQARDAIDAVRALLEILERRVQAAELAPLRNALSQLQMAYAREMQASGAEPPGENQPAGAGQATQTPPGAEQPPAGHTPGKEGSSGPGPAESSGRLWVPGR